jgi:hypothetical protein
MTNENEKPAPKAPKKTILAALAAEEGIPVRLLKFTRPGGLDVPGMTAANSLKAGDQYEITFLPRLRFYRCVHTPANREKSQVTWFIHETWASWEPLEQ